ncbi:serine hydrolase [Streptomyces luomodiensis]|uniref:Serine hydrolase n=1 Tax=Streptomyces luomodiensis TaxID=3026192 RepID=A0ABY9V832_9ACTN|nr:serine hydrolase [Streptomyces sp. SCA4-21]WNF00767.1 serine hydrolase [Streptomyces sp. SCA4-21]
MDRDRIPQPPGTGVAQPPRPGRSWPPLRKAGATAVVLVAVIGLCVGLTSGEDGSLSWPWPREGQTSVLVEGTGDTGETGGAGGTGDTGDIGDVATEGAQRPVPIASVTKVMTAYVILRDHPLRAGEAGPDITVDQPAADESGSGSESSVRVRAGQRLSERHVLELMLIPSGNNIARLLARWDAGSQEAFVAEMNRAAHDLGMRHTTYSGASGIESTTTSTSADQLKLARRVMRDEVLRAIVAKPSTTVPGVPGPIRNTNTLLGTAGVIGLKTGSSTPAGGALMWAATAPDGAGHDRLILGVVLHQRAGSSPQEGLQAALDSSRTLIEAVRRWVSTTTSGTW